MRKLLFVIVCAASIAAYSQTQEEKAALAFFKKNFPQKQIIEYSSDTVYIPFFEMNAGAIAISQDWTKFVTELVAAGDIPRKSIPIVRKYDKLSQDYRNILRKCEERMGMQSIDRNEPIIYHKVRVLIAYRTHQGTDAIYIYSQIARPGNVQDEFFYAKSLEQLREQYYGFVRDINKEKIYFGIN